MGNKERKLNIYNRNDKYNFSKNVKSIYKQLNDI